jgi:hypothetical protein
MNRNGWLLLLVACLLASSSVAAPSYAVAGVSSVAAVQQGVAEPLVATYVGRTVIRTTEPLALRSARDVTATSREGALTDYLWKLNGQVVSTSPELVIPVSAPGDYALELNYRDTQGRSYATLVTVRAMGPAAYDAMLTAVQAAAHLSLWMEDEEVFLPHVTR